MSGPYVLAIDQGTTSTRAVVYDHGGRSVGTAGLQLAQHYPRPGWVEHDPEEIWTAVARVVPQALAKAGVEPKQLAAIGITNQRETTVLWERAGGRSLGRALVWQDRRTADFCEDRRANEAWVGERTGLVLDPYFSATKIRWMLDHRDGARARAAAGDLAFGTIDSYLIWQLTGGEVHATDVTNASRTLLMNLRQGAWDEDLCRFFDVPVALLPKIRPSVGIFGRTAGLGFLPDGLPVTGVAGDQQASLFGQCGFEAGAAKCTYGTGAFMLLHTGDRPVTSRSRLLCTRAASAGGEARFALEGSVFIAGAAVQWLRDGLHLISSAEEVGPLASRADPQQAVVFVPALVGLGAPHWVPQAQGVVFGITRGTTAAELARAALEGVALQVTDLLDAARADSGVAVARLMVDGGMARNPWLLALQADLLGVDLVPAVDSESTALGAAMLAGLGQGLWEGEDALRRLRPGRDPVRPAMDAGERSARLSQWRRAVQAVVDFYAPRSRG